MPLLIAPQGISVWLNSAKTIRWRGAMRWPRSSATVPSMPTPKPVAASAKAGRPGNRRRTAGDAGRGHRRGLPRRRPQARWRRARPLARTAVRPGCGRDGGADPGAAFQRQGQLRAAEGRVAGVDGHGHRGQQSQRGGLRGVQPRDGDRAGDDEHGKRPQQVVHSASSDGSGAAGPVGAARVRQRVTQPAHAPEQARVGVMSFMHRGSSCVIIFDL